MTEYKDIPCLKEHDEGFYAALAEQSTRGWPCEECSGSGEIVTDWHHYMTAYEGNFDGETALDCPHCKGTGRASAVPNGEL